MLNKLLQKYRKTLDIPKQYKIEDLKRTWTEYVDPRDLEH